MSNVMSLPNLKNHVSRNGFDLSEKVAFTAKVGQLLPIMHKEVIPGDKFKINVKAFARTQPVNTAAFTRIRQYYDFFFVPWSQLWRNFGNFVTQINDAKNRASSLTSDIDIPQYCPFFSSLDLARYIYNVSHVTEKNENKVSWSDTYAINKDVCGFNRGSLSVKLLRYLGYGDFTPWLTYSTGTSGTNPVPFVAAKKNISLSAGPLAAYQKICEDFYRNSQWQNTSPWSYNFDYWNGSALDLGDLYNSTSFVASNQFDLFTMRYVNWQKDYFFGLIPKNSDTGVSRYGAQSAVISVLGIRQAEALQKWKEISDTNNKDYKSQVEAHFGVKMSSAMSEMVTYLGGTSDSLDISEVVNQNLFENGAANIQGKGVGVTDGYIDFEAKEHGFIMCVYHAIPLLDYANSGLLPSVQKISASSFAIPELDSIGLQEVPTEQLVCDYTKDAFSGGLGSLGYAPRYFDYKTAYDRVLGSFLTTEASWTAPISDKYINNYLLSGAGDVSKRMDYRMMKVNPSILNPIFAVWANGQESTDQLLINTAFDIKAVRNLDYNGLPY